MKKFLSLLLTLALALSLAACGGKDAGTTTPPPRRIQRRFRPDRGPASRRGRDHHRGRPGLRL